MEGAAAKQVVALIFVGLVSKSKKVGLIRREISELRSAKSVRWGRGSADVLLMFMEAIMPSGRALPHRKRTFSRSNAKLILFRGKMRECVRKCGNERPESSIVLGGAAASGSLSLYS